MTNRKFVLTARASALALLIGIPAAPAFAAEDDATVEELVVTARKRDEALIDVPFSVVWISSAARTPRR